MNDWPTRPQQALQPSAVYHPAPQRESWAIRLAPAAVSLAVLGFVIAVCGLAYAVSRPAAPAPKTVTHTVVKWKTRTVNHTRTVTKTVDVPQPSSGDTVTCYPYGGQAYLSSPGTSVPASSCTLTVAPVYPLSSGEVTITVTAPDGDSSVLTAAS